MSLIKIGDACASLGGKSYIKIGVAFQDPEHDNRIALKIDALPLLGTNWQGWINIFPDTRPKPPRPQVAASSDDDFPF